MKARHHLKHILRSNPAFYIVPKKYRAGPKPIQTPVPFHPPADFHATNNTVDALSHSYLYHNSLKA